MSILSVAEAASLLRNRQVSPVELTREALERASRLNPTSHCFITIDAEASLEQARLAEEEIGKGKYRGGLHGIPVSLKDNLDTAALRTTAGSEILRNRVPKADGAAAAALRACGAILIGKTNMHEFAYGITSQNPHYGAVANPWLPGRIAGGSSGGSAASLAYGIGYASVGTDTGGSIRIPASFCGVVGLKPTFDLISVAGSVPLAKSMDHIGPLGRRVADVACAFAALTSRRGAPNDDEQRFSLKGVRIGWPQGFYFDLIDAEVLSLLQEAAACFISLGAQIEEVRLDHLEDAIQAATKLQQFEATAWHRSQGYFPAHADRYGEDVRRLLETGDALSAPSLLEVPAALQRLRASFDQAFSAADALLVPATPSAAPPVGATELALAGRTESLRAAIMRLNRPTNFSGCPSLAVPCGFTALGLPVGMQLIGPRLSEDRLLSIANKYEQANQWYLRRPPVLIPPSETAA